MSYYTTLKMWNSFEDEQSVLQIAGSIDSEYTDDFVEELERLFADEFVSVRNFGQWMNAMFAELSERLPDEAIIVTGIGESSDDVWTRKYRQGNAYVRGLQKEEHEELPKYFLASVAIPSSGSTDEGQAVDFEGLCMTAYPEVDKNNRREMLWVHGAKDNETRLVVVDPSVSCTTPQFTVNGKPSFHPLVLFPSCHEMARNGEAGGRAFAEHYDRAFGHGQSEVGTPNADSVQQESKDANKDQSMEGTAQ